MKQNTASFRSAISTKPKSRPQKTEREARVYEISELHLLSNHLSPKQVPVSARGGGEIEKGFTSLKKSSMLSPQSRSSRKQADSDDITDDDVQRLLKELRGEKVENVGQRKEAQIKNPKETKRKSEMKAKSKEGINDLQKNIRNIQQNLEQLQDAFKSEVLKASLYEDQNKKLERQNDEKTQQTRSVSSGKAQTSTTPLTNISSTPLQINELSGINMITPQKNSESKLYQQENLPSGSIKSSPADQKTHAPSGVLEKLRIQMNYKGPSLSGTYRLPTGKALMKR